MFNHNLRHVENLFLREKIADISSDAYLDDKGVAYLSYSEVIVILVYLFVVVGS
ncbi:Uncharacterised protein [Mycobacteroides abscessus subsp. abscessus]|nr:Uncharacterised protein [Mycobacteroides abscessus subsp. abscessus]